MSCKRFYIIFAVLLHALCNAQEVPSGGFLKREHSLIKPYSGTVRYIFKVKLWFFYFNFISILGTGMSMPMWDFRDNVMVTNNFVRLTQDHQGKIGAIWNKIVNANLKKTQQFRIYFFNNFSLFLFVIGKYKFNSMYMEVEGL